jgi:hypothetical protein
VIGLKIFFLNFIGPGAASRLTLKNNSNDNNNDNNNNGSTIQKVSLSMIKNPNKWMTAVEEEGMGIGERETLSLESQTLVVFINLSFH